MTVDRMKEILKHIAGEIKNMREVRVTRKDAEDIYDLTDKVVFEVYALETSIDEQVLKFPSDES